MFHCTFAIEWIFHRSNQSNEWKKDKQLKINFGFFFGVRVQFFNFIFLRLTIFSLMLYLYELNPIDWDGYHWKKENGKNLYMHFIWLKQSCEICNTKQNNCQLKSFFYERLFMYEHKFFCDSWIILRHLNQIINYQRLAFISKWYHTTKRRVILQRSISYRIN